MLDIWYNIFCKLLHDDFGDRDKKKSTSKNLPFLNLKSHTANRNDKICFGESEVASKNLKNVGH